MSNGMLNNEELRPEPQSPSQISIFFDPDGKDSAEKSKNTNNIFYCPAIGLSVPRIYFVHHQKKRL